MKRGGYNWRKHLKGGRGRGKRHGSGGRGFNRGNNYRNGGRNNFNRERDYSNHTFPDCELSRQLSNMENSQYGRLKSLTGRRFDVKMNDGKCQLFIDRIQSDPYAPPSQIRIRVPQTFDKQFRATKIRAIALSDFLCRKFREESERRGYDRRAEGNWAEKKGGDILISELSQHVLERSTLKIADNFIEARVRVNIPARGRKICGLWAAEIFCKNLPELCANTLISKSTDLNSLETYVISIEDQENLRAQLGGLGLVGFVKNGAILPRKTGSNDQPLDANAVPFQSPESLEVEITVKSGRKLKGMAIRKGITVIAGGGYHGKSTLLNALEYGIYNHIPGDGREFVCVSSLAVKIRAEDGRVMNNVDISSFIGTLPQGKDTANFSSNDCSGSTSQAGNIIEAMEAGADCFLLDEDICATNFLIQDPFMQKIVHQEPITPLVAKIRDLADNGISSILVLGSCSAYFHSADTILLMEQFSPKDISQKVKEMLSEVPRATASRFGGYKSRTPDSRTVAENGKKKSTLDQILFGNRKIDLRAVSQLVEVGQTRSITEALMHLSRVNGRSVKSILDSLDREFEQSGIDFLANKNGDFVGCRRFEIVAALNRLPDVTFNLV